MMNEMTKEMMKECCGDDGKPSLAKMRGFMEKCGKNEFTDDELKMMQEFCDQSGNPEPDKMKQLMESCGCQADRVTVGH